MQKIHLKGIQNFENNYDEPNSEETLKLTFKTFKTCIEILSLPIKYIFRNMFKRKNVRTFRFKFHTGVNLILFLTYHFKNCLNGFLVQIILIRLDVNKQTNKSFKHIITLHLILHRRSEIKL